MVLNYKSNKLLASCGCVLYYMSLPDVCMRITFGDLKKLLEIDFGGKYVHFKDDSVSLPCRVAFMSLVGN